MNCVKPEKLGWLAKYRLFCAIGSLIYVGLLFGFSYQFYFNFLTNWGNTALAIVFTMLAIAHFKQGHYKKESNLRVNGTDGLYWKLVVLGYEAMVLLITMITIGYWTAIFPTDLVLPDDVAKPNLN